MRIPRNKRFALEYLKMSLGSKYKMEMGARTTYQSRSYHLWEKLFPVPYETWNGHWVHIVADKVVSDESTLMPMQDQMKSFPLNIAREVSSSEKEM